MVNIRALVHVGEAPPSRPTRGGCTNLFFTRGLARLTFNMKNGVSSVITEGNVGAGKNIGQEPDGGDGLYALAFVL